MLIPMAFFGLLSLAWKRAGNNKGMNEERRKVYLGALENLADTTKLRGLANEFEKYGCEAEANVLRRRADYRDLPKEKKEAYREVYQKAMGSDKATPEDLERLANRFEAITAIKSAQNLRQRAKELRQEKLDLAKKEKEIQDREVKKAVEEARKTESETPTVVEAKAEVVETQN